MPGRIIENALPEIIKGLFILLFTYTAFSKLVAIKQFQFVLYTSPLLRTYSKLLAPLIPSVELSIAALIFIPATAKTGMIAGVSLLLLFTIYIVFMILTDPNLPCSCGGVIQQLSWKQHVAFNIFFIITGIIGIYMRKKKSREVK